MKRLQNKTNVDAPSIDWPFGDLNDDSGANDGTPVDKELITDIQQTFEKIFDASGLTANGLPDNATNGFQLYEALREVIKPYDVIQGFIDDAGFTETLNETGETITFNRVGNGDYELNITNNAYTADKTGVLIAGDIAEQGATDFKLLGAKVVSTSKIRVTYMTCFFTTTNTLAGTNINDKRYIEIRIDRP